MPIRALLRPLAAGVLIVASAGALAASATARQAAVAFAEPPMPAWPMTAGTVAHSRPLVAQFFAGAREDQAARIRAQMERMEARARADDRLNGRVQPRESAAAATGNSRSACARNAATPIKATGAVRAGADAKRAPLHRPELALGQPCRTG